MKTKTQYDGRFDLEFLIEGSREGVRSAGDGTGAVEVFRHDQTIIRLEVGDWLVRNPDGTLSAEVTQ